MSYAAQLASFSMVAFAALLLLLQLAAKEIGYVIGRRASRADEPPESVAVIVTGMLGLLAFVLGLTLTYANTRYQERRQAALAEAQSIGTSWLRAQAVGLPQGAEIARLIEDYAQLRLEFVGAPHDAAALDTLEQRSAAVQSEIWQQVIMLAQARSDAVAASLITSLNETFDRGMGQRYAFASGPAPQLLGLLLAMAMASMGGLGFQFGLRGRPVRALSVLMLGMWTAVLVVIADLGAPRLGGIRTDPAPYHWTIESFGFGANRPRGPH